MPSALTPDVKPTNSQAHPFLGFCFLFSQSSLSPPRDHKQLPSSYSSNVVPRAICGALAPRESQYEGCLDFWRTLCHIIWLPFRVRWRHTVVMVVGTVLLGSFSVTLFLSLAFPHFLVGRMPPLRAHWGQEPELRQGTQIVLSKARRGRCFFLLPWHPLSVRGLALFPPNSLRILPSVEEDFVSGGLLGSF